MEYSDMKATTCRGKVCGDSVEGFDCGDAAATWFSQVLERPCRLMRQMLTSERLSKFASKGMYAYDWHPVDFFINL
jgi:hypothetical protein